MITQGLKYLLIALMLLSYLNRGLFVAAPEAEPVGIPGKGEINSMVEFLQKIITGYENDIDEDGDCPESYNFTTSQILIDQSLIAALALKQPPLSICKNLFPLSETILPSPIYGVVDHPPEKWTVNIQG
jgi:hypothetical protein